MELENGLVLVFLYILMWIVVFLVCYNTKRDIFIRHIKEVNKKCEEGSMCSSCAREFKPHGFPVYCDECYDESFYTAPLAQNEEIVKLTP